MARIAFVYRSRSSFVDQDIRTLETRHDVEPVQWRGKRSLPQVARAVRRADLVFTWFALDHAFVAGHWARMLRRPHVVVAGGVDVAYEPEIGYGRFTEGRLRRHMTRWTLDHAELVLAVSGFARSSAERFARPKRIEVVYNGIDAERFRPAPLKERLVVSMGPVTNSGIRLKGLDTFAHATAKIKDARAVVIGATEPEAAAKLRAAHPDIELLGALPHDAVAETLARALVFAQLSFTESFGVGVSEAMASGCIPVVSGRGALPETVGAVGRSVSYGDVEATHDAIRLALDEGAEADRQACREWVRQQFTHDARAKRLLVLVGALLPADQRDAF